MILPFCDLVAECLLRVLRV